MGRFPIDAPKARAVKALEQLGFRMVREAEHIAMLRVNADGTRTPLTMPTITAASRARHCVRSALKPVSHGVNSWMRTETRSDGLRRTANRVREISQ
jgi:hypothetical protein